MQRAHAVSLAGLLVLALPLLGGCVQRGNGIARTTPQGPVHERMRAGETIARSGDIGTAIERYRAAVAADPAAIRPHLRYTRAMLSQGRRAQLRDEYAERSQRVGATAAERTIHERLMTNGASSALRRVYEAATLREPGSPWWFLALAEVETMEAEAWNRKRIRARERGEREATEQGFAQSRGAVRRANRAVERAGRLQPDLAEVWLYRGYLRSVEGDLRDSEPGRLASYEAAKYSFAMAASLDGELLEAWSGYGESSFELGDHRESLVAYLRAVRRAPADPQLRTSLGVVLHEIGRLREAAEQYRQAATLQPWDPDPLLRLGDALADAEDWDKALKAYEAALARDAQAVEGHYKMGAVLEYRNRPGEARAAYERYVSMDGERAELAQRRIERLLRAERR